MTRASISYEINPVFADGSVYAVENDFADLFVIEELFHFFITDEYYKTETPYSVAIDYFFVGLQRCI